MMVKLLQKKQNHRRKQWKEVEVSHDESEDEDHVPTPSSDLLPSGEDSYTLNELMVFCTNLQEQGRIIEEIDQNDEIALDADTQGRKNDDEMFRVDDLSGEEVVLDTTTGEHKEHIIEDVSTVEPVNTVSEVVTTVADKVNDVPTTDVIEHQITMAQALAALNSTKPKVVVQEQEVSTTIPAVAITVTTVVLTPRAKGIVFHEQKQSHILTVSLSKDKGKAKMIEPGVPIKMKDHMRMDEEYATFQLEVSTTIPAVAITVTTVVLTPRAKGIVFHEQKQSHILTVSLSKDKGKAKMIEPGVPIKMKDHMRMDEEYARQLEAEEQEAARLSRAEQDEEANISWDNT
nr:hypothetical protein [Tanacetum cinerariifolium]